jgi:hypothetical protein
LIDPNEWQDWIIRLLKQRYGYQLVEIPDTVGGDCGIEAYSRDGCCYQCYAPEGSPSTKERYDRCRDKMTTDLGKFCTNAADLHRLFGSTVISQWVFVTPQHDDRKLVEHAQKKAAEIREKRLPYVDPTSFEVHIVTDAYFEREAALLLSDGLQKLRLPPSMIGADDATTFSGATSEQIDNLDRKLQRIYPADGRRTSARSLCLRYYLQGLAALGYLGAYPDVEQAFMRLRTARAGYLEFESLNRTTAAPNVLSETIAAFAAEVRQRMPALDHFADDLAHGATVTWLLECPLNFPEPDL